MALQHDNTSDPTTLPFGDFCHNTIVMPWLPYSPNLDRFEIFLFLNLKKPMDERKFAAIEEIKASLGKFKLIPKVLRGLGKYVYYI